VLVTENQKEEYLIITIPTGITTQWPFGLLVHGYTALLSVT